MTPAGLPPAALLLVLASALLHASWNVLLARVPRGHDTTAVALALGLIALAPVALARWRVDSGVWPYVLLSAAFELMYFAALNLAYTRAPAHAAYPVARGLAPVLLLPAALVTGARPPLWAGLGVGAISAGILLTTRGSADRRALGYAVPVAICVAGYTFVDSVGVRHADPATYLWLTMVPVAAVMLVARTAAGRGVAALRAELRPSTFVVGLGVFGAYGLVLAALATVTAGQVPAVAAVRETGILFVVALSWWPASRRPAIAPPEPGRPRRPRPALTAGAGAVLVFAGVVALTLTR